MSVDTAAGQAPTLDLIARVPVTVQVVLGSVKMPIADLARIAAGSSLLLEQQLTDPVTVLVNGHRVALGELYVMEGEEGQLAVKITEVFRPRELI
jgi:flagellar motor switch protein FliN/FliY